MAQTNNNEILRTDGWVASGIEDADTVWVIQNSGPAEIEIYISPIQPLDTDSGHILSIRMGATSETFGIGKVWIRARQEKAIYVITK